MNGEKNKETPVVRKPEVEGFVGVTGEDAQQYLNNYKAHKKGITHEEMIQVYSDWADKYDEDLSPGRYNGPSIAAEAMASFYSTEIRKELKILDVAAGTGRVGMELIPLGFCNVDALEPSSGMLRILKERGLYTNTYESAIGLHPVQDIETDTYDCLVIAGGMGESHIPVKAVDEMIRMVKPEGCIFIVMREEYLSYVEEYVNKLEPYMSKMNHKGYWKQVSRTVVPNYSFNKNGIVFHYKVEKSGSPSESD